MESTNCSFQRRQLRSPIKQTKYYNLPNDYFIGAPEEEYDYSLRILIGLRQNTPLDGWSERQQSNMRLWLAYSLDLNSGFTCSFGKGFG
jgi:hypothetical protein